MRPGVILDRDGTLIDFVRDAELGSVASAFHPDQLRVLPGVFEGLSLLQEAGYVLAMATNQPDAAKGKIAPSAIARTNQALVDLFGQRDIEIVATRVCLHHPEGGPGGDPSLIGPCECRKPAPGMLLSLIDELGLDPSRSWMIGDTAADLGAAHDAGLRCGLLVPVNRCEICPLRDAPRLDPPPAVSHRRFEKLVAGLLAAD